MKPEAVLQALIDYRIDLAPVLDNAGILLWTAAIVKLAPDGWQNFVSERDFAQGDTPQEAVGALVAKLRRQEKKPVVLLPKAKPEAAPKRKSLKKEKEPK